MDIKTIFICLFIINLFLGFFIFLIKKTQTALPGIDLWIVANFLIACGYFLLSQRLVISDILSVVFGQSLFFLAGLFRIYGLKHFFKLRFTVLINILMALAFITYVLLMAYYTLVQNNIFIRTIISGLVLSSLAVITGLIILKKRPENKRFTYNFTAFIFFIFSSIFISRIMGWILFPEIRDLFASAFINNLQFASSMLIDITWGIMFFVIHNQKLTNDLALSESRFKNIFENHNAVMLLIDPQSKKIIEANKAAVKFYGFPKSELSQLTLDNLTSETSALNMPDTSFEECNCQIFTQILANKTERIVEVHSTPIDILGQNLHFSIIHDITERKKAEQALKESEEKFRAIFEKNSSAIIIIDNKTNIINANQTFLNLTGYTKEEIIGTSWTNLITKNDSARLLDFNRKRLLNVPGVPDQYEFTFYNKKLEVRHGLIIVAYLPQKQNVIASFIDITERKEHETELQEFANKLDKLNSDKDKFISILAHDLKGPFNVLLGFSDLLLANLHIYDMQKIEDQLTMMNETTHRTYELLEQILLWARSQAGKLNFESVKFNFNEIVGDLIKIHQMQAMGKEIKISLIETDKLVLNADLNMFKTIMRNLISNAIKFTNKNGQIRISAEKKQNTAIITVADDGIGIDANIIAKLWDLTEHYTRSGTNKEQGTGFGLKLCKELIEKHGGQIWVESQAGQGSKFKFTLPAVD